MLKQVAYNVFIGPLAVPILFELQHGLLKTGFLPRIPPTHESHVGKRGASCKDYTGIKTGGWKFTGEGCV